MKEEEEQALFDELLAHQERPEIVYHHKWISRDPVKILAKRPPGQTEIHLPQEANASLFAWSLPGETISWRSACHNRGGDHREELRSRPSDWG